MIIFGSNDKKLKVFEYFKSLIVQSLLKDEQAEIIKILINIWLRQYLLQILLIIS